MGQMHSSMAPPAMPPYSMAGGRFVNPRMPMGQIRGPVAHAPRFYGHDPNTKRKINFYLSFIRINCKLLVCAIAKIL